MVPHKNVLRALGVCYSPLALLTELAEMDLLTFMKTSNWWRNSDHVLQIAKDIVQGMIHLHVLFSFSSLSDIDLLELQHFTL